MVVVTESAGVGKGSQEGEEEVGHEDASFRRTLTRFVSNL